ncbi:helix-turn-helix domain-containing protein [Actinomadura atramentaria]|uniref:helix-turn-helix domain-containing protein n=1 Tax=Actinomadura atramentaria TaxID=1990 RepID=UPI0004781CCE|nr:helix-turn-helix transcriptional regulator [Actinomadura atramentaria]
MPSSLSSSAQAARERLGEQLRKIRTDARINGVEFARRAGWRDSSLVSRTERGQRPITAETVKLWCRLCDVPDQQTAELLAEQANVARTWISLREHHELGLDARQKATVGDLHSRVVSELSYQTKLVHGLLQTEDYMTQVLRGVRRDRRLKQDDVPQAVATRMARQRNLHRPGSRWAFLLEEAVLRYQYFPADVHRAQLDYLSEAMRLPAVSIGIIPTEGRRHGVRVRESFAISTFADGTQVRVELLSGMLTLTHPEDITLYRRAWDDLVALAVTGDTARALISAARDSLV